MQSTESPLMRVTLPNGTGTQPMMNTGRERTAVRAMETLRAVGANPLPTHRLPNGMGYVAPDTGRVHGPERPAIIAHRYWCPSCDAQPAEPCRLSPRFTQKWSHETRHRVAQRALWRELMREYDIRIAR